MNLSLQEIESLSVRLHRKAYLCEGLASAISNSRDRVVD